MITISAPSARGASPDIYGIIDSKGHEIVPCKYAWIQTIGAGLFIIRDPKDEVYGGYISAQIIDANGKIISISLPQDTYLIMPRLPKVAGELALKGQNGLPLGTLFQVVSKEGYSVLTADGTEIVKCQSELPRAYEVGNYVCFKGVNTFDVYDQVACRKVFDPEMLEQLEEYLRPPKPVNRKFRNVRNDGFKKIRIDQVGGGLAVLKRFPIEECPVFDTKTGKTILKLSTHSADVKADDNLIVSREPSRGTEREDRITIMNRDGVVLFSDINHTVTFPKYDMVVVSPKHKGMVIDKFPGTIFTPKGASFHSDDLGTALPALPDRLIIRRPNPSHWRELWAKDLKFRDVLFGYFLRTNNLIAMPKQQAETLLGKHEHIAIYQTGINNDGYGIDLQYANDRVTAWRFCQSSAFQISKSPWITKNVVFDLDRDFAKDKSETRWRKIVLVDKTSK